MLNLLFISNSPKAQCIKNMLQPVLKVIIDIVPDFDQGLKDMFEKRPATVCIQNQIAGVTGESVARHIKMLLGVGAPTFILMHEGNSNIKPVKGLFEHIIDLNQTDAELAENFQNTLKTLLGEKWSKVYIPPILTATSVSSSVSVQQEPQKDTTELADMDMPLIKASQPQFDDTFAEKSADVIAAHETIKDPSGGIASELADEDVFADKIKSVPEPVVTSCKCSNVFSLTVDKVKPVPEPVVTFAPVVPSEFRISKDKISQNKESSEEPVPEKLPLTLEAEFRPKTNYLKRSLLVLLALSGVFAAGSYLLEQYPNLLTILKQRALPATTPLIKKPSAIAISSLSERKRSQAQLQLQKPLAPVTTVPALPVFIPQEGHDSSYSAKNPGWDRYVGKNYEIRVFKAGGAIIAVQVLSVKGKQLSEYFLKSVIKELAGSSEYHINTTETKAGMMVQSGTIAKKAEILIYRKKKSLQAFVVSIN